MQKYWYKITSDPEVISIISEGVKIKFEDFIPTNSPFQYKRSKLETLVMDKEIQKLLDMGAISVCANEEGYFSNMFTKQKSDGSYRCILNLKSLNPHCQKSKFKMASIRDVLHMIKPNHYLASIDIKNAYFSVPINEKYKKFLRFSWRNKIYEFQVLPNGFNDAMRIFCKIMKGPISTLRKMGFAIIIYVDDALLQGETYQECLENILETIKLLQQLGFTINFKKSSLTPTQIITFIGFQFNTRDMTITLIQNKKEKLIKKAKRIKDSKNPSIREVSSLLGSITAALEAVPYGKLNYKDLEIDKIISLKISKGNFDKPCHISDKGMHNINWWIHNLPSAVKSLLPLPRIDYTIFTDASPQGWGAHDGEKDINGIWQFPTDNIHINILELKAVKNALLEFLPRHNTNHIRIMSDNNTTVSHINKQGGTKSRSCNTLAGDCWSLAISANSHLSAAHIPGEHNLLADYKSRQYRDSAEWSIDGETFKKIIWLFGTPDIDMFASNKNHKFQKYISWGPDPSAFKIDAFSIYWDKYFGFYFPPFSILAKTIKKLRIEGERAIIVCPLWPTQQWFTDLLEMAIETPVWFSSSKLYLPDSKEKHPLGKKLTMVAVLCSNLKVFQMPYRSLLQTYSRRHGDLLHIQNTKILQRNGKCFVSKGKLIHIMPL